MPCFIALPYSAGVVLNVLLTSTALNHYLASDAKWHLPCLTGQINCVDTTLFSGIYQDDKIHKCVQD